MNQLNVRRGLLRLWLVVSIIWMLLVGIVSFEGIESEFRSASRGYSGAAVIGLPIYCRDARGQIGKDYEEGAQKGTCWYREPEFRALFPEYADLNTNDLAIKLYEKIGVPIRVARPWQQLGLVILFGIGPPLVILVFSFALAWAIGGFAAAS